MAEIALFEEYLEGRLSGEEKDRFEQRLKDDPGFSEEFDRYKTLQAELQQWQQTADQRQQLKQTLGRITGTDTGSKTITRPWRRIVWPAAAMVVILIGSLWWLLAPAAQDNSKLFAQYAAGEKISIPRGATGTDSLWEKASATLYDKHYDETVAALQQLVATGKDSSQAAAAWLGYCYLQMNNDSAAEHILTQTVFREKEVAERADWYKALLYLKTGRKDQCIETLTRLASSGGAYAEKATVLLQEKIHRKK